MEPQSSFKVWSDSGFHGDFVESGVTFIRNPVVIPGMEQRSVALTPMKAELVTRFATQAIREGNLTQPEEDAARELRKDIATAEPIQKLG